MAERSPIKGLILPEDLDDMSDVDALNTNWEILDREPKIENLEVGTELYPTDDGRPRFHITREAIYDRTYGGNFGASSRLAVVNSSGEIRTLNRDTPIPLSYYPFNIVRGVAVETDFRTSETSVRTGEVTLPAGAFSEAPHVEVAVEFTPASTMSDRVNSSMEFLSIGTQAYPESFRYRLWWDIRDNLRSSAQYSRIRLYWTAIDRKGT